MTRRAFSHVRDWVLAGCCLIGAVLGAAGERASDEPLDRAVVRPPDIGRDTLLARELGSEKGALAAIYSSPELLWIRDGDASAQAREILASMRDAEAFGLDSEDYRAADLESKWGSSAHSPQQNAQWDFSVSVSVLRFISHLHRGRVDASAAGFDLPEREKFDGAAELRRVAAASNVSQALAVLEPSFVHYALLKTSLRKYRVMSQAPIDSLPPLDAEAVKVGDYYKGMASLRARLVAENDLDRDSWDTASPLSMDVVTADALKRFQFRYGIQMDGVLGTETYRALSVPLSRRVRQIELTLERWRWLPANSGPTVIVNIPQFRLFAFESERDREEEMTTMDVIVGKTFPHTRTPAFAADMTHIVFRPYWDVPRSILSREMLPKARVDADYFSKEGLEIVDARNGLPVAAAREEVLRDLTEGALRVRQPPGPTNALGLVKFVLPNSYDVYLHSTPSRELFNRSRRAFSHGCIRVSDPDGLAQYALRVAGKGAAWSKVQIEAAMNGTETVRVDFARPIHVLIVYGTAVATTAKGTYFFDDLYGNDLRLEKLLTDTSRPYR